MEWIKGDTKTKVVRCVRKREMKNVEGGECKVGGELDCVCVTKKYYIKRNSKKQMCRPIEKS